MKRLSFFISLMIVFVFAFGFFLPTRTPLPVTKKPNNLPDAWMEMVDATLMNENGQVLMKIHAPKVVHYPENDTSKLTTPEFLLYGRRATPWRIQSGLAIANDGIKQIHLSKLVTLYHPQDDFQPATWVNTDKLVIHPKQRTAETMENVTLTQPNIHLKGKGLSADLESGEIKLLSDTQGEYSFNE